jgi:hypothetical protein
MTTLVRHTLADDAFYYFGLARHFPNPSFDPGVPTTGFHPLYWALIGPVFRLVPGTAPVRLALLLLLTAHVCTGAVIWRLARRHFSAPVAVGAGLTWMLDPHVRALALLGVETALVILGLAVLVLVTDAGEASYRRTAVVGLLVGACFLARTDSVIVSSIVVAAWLFRVSRSWRDGLRRLGLLGACGLAVASPWLAYLGARGALARQDSQVAEHLLSARRGLTWSFLPSVWGFVASHLAYCLDPWSRAGTYPPMTGQLMVLVLVLCAWLGLSHCERWRDSVSATAPVLVGTVLLFTAYAVLFHHLSAWYVLYACLAAWIGVVPAALALPFASLGRTAASTALVVAPVALVAGTFVSQQDFAAGQLDKYRAVHALSRWVPNGDPIGAMNDGLVSFFHPGGSVDLDGVVDRGASEALAQQRMCQFVRSRRVEWLVDDPGALARLLELGPGLLAGPVIRVADATGEPVAGQVQVVARLDSSAC